jgi:hypothetical protein
LLHLRKINTKDVNDFTHITLELIIDDDGKSSVSFILWIIYYVLDFAQPDDCHSILVVNYSQLGG